MTQSSGHVLWRIRQSEWPLWQKMSEKSRREVLSAAFQSWFATWISYNLLFRILVPPVFVANVKIRETRSLPLSREIACDENFVKFLFFFPHLFFPDSLYYVIFGRGFCDAKFFSSRVYVFRSFFSLSFHFWEKKLRNLRDNIVK